MPQIKCLLFDCDNTLVLSENAAFEACAQLANQILEKFGFEKRYGGTELMHQFVGQNFRSMMTGLCSRHGFTIPADEFDQWVAKELDTTIANLRAKAEPCENVIEVLEKLQKDKKYHMAIVSSSAMPRVVASIEKTKMDQFFGKPDEGIFSAASSINPPECIAIEDSRSGATAAKNAGIPLLGYVGPYYEEGQEKLDSMIKLFKEELGAFDVMHNWKDFESILAKYESS
ncbi:validoxylamine A 7'-phosphate phosphatase [Colletotrichum liriopes]|uniref:Validoxylamine A 7'-phosphate phosphatase n=1 Tax=Colletotrichum liriopes TaxID=708192 RepID=A0AA37GXU4_9PEZI|nr:validoxylamine A 7'-phosphate phosphatase [Colletotrichum liriopes]